jgi:hypothetical protein
MTETPRVNWARLSLFYLAGYLGITGIAFLAVPRQALSLLLATRTYDDTFVRLVGAFMIALSALVTQIIRHRLDVLYTTTLAVRAFFLIVIVGLYLDTRDRAFLMIFGVVALGFALTLTGTIADRRSAK